MTTINRDEWLQALGQAAAPVEPNAMSIAELCDLFAIDRMTCYRRMGALVKAGRARQTWKFAMLSNGARRRVPAYVLVTPEKKRR